MIAFPNELLWKDSELFPGKWFQDGSGLGQYGQKYPSRSPIPFLEKQERDKDRREAAKLVLEIPPEDMPPMLRTQTQIEAYIARHASKRHRPVLTFDTGLTWWQELPFLTIEERALIDDFFNWEINHGDWN